MSAAKALALVASALFGLGCGTFALSFLVDFDSPERARLAALADPQHEFNLAIIGSSLVARHFIPSVFDEEMARQGFAIRSFNLGADAMNVYEQDHWLGELLQVAPKPLRWILLDVTIAPDPGFFLHDNYSNRTLDWHTPTQIVEVFRYHRPRVKRLGELGAAMAPHIRHFLARTLLAGQGIRLVERTCWADAAPYSVPPAGYATVDDPLEAARAARFRKERRKDWLGRVLTLEAKLARRNAHPVTIARIDRWQEQIAATGRDAVFVRSPSMMLWRTPAQATREKDPISFLDLADPTDFSELFAFENQMDERHLTLEGAKLYSVRLAEQFAKSLRDQGKTSPVNVDRDVN